MAKRPKNAPIEVEEEIKIPAVWLIVGGLVAVGFLVTLFVSGAMVIWPFVFAVAVLLIINDASEQTGAGVPPLQAYGLFFGVLIAFSLFVALVSTINIWLLTILLIVAGFYLYRDWKERQKREGEMHRRRLAGVCVRCCEPVTNGIEDICFNCGMPVHPERMNLLRLGRAISNRAQSQRTRQVLTGTAPLKSQVKLQTMQQNRAYRYKKGK